MPVVNPQPDRPSEPPRLPFVQALQRLFRSILPRDRLFVDCFCRHSILVAQAAEAFRAMMVEDRPTLAQCEEIDRLEAEADQITRQAVRAVHRLYITPFDRAQIRDLITALDDAIDLMKQSSRRLIRYDVSFHPGNARHGGLRGARHAAHPRRDAPAGGNQPQRPDAERHLDHGARHRGGGR